MTYGNHHEATVLEVVQPPYIFCFSYGDIDGGPVKVFSLPDFPLYKKEPRNDREVVKKLHSVLSSADTIVAHNIRYDLRRAYARFMFYRLKPIKPLKTICTLRLARRLGDFPSNSLKELALYFGVTHKMEISKNLWQRVHFDQDPKAWREMCKYNKVDIIAGREIYKILWAWSGRPDYTKRPNAICECGSKDVQMRGPSKNGKKHYFVCKKCHRWGLVILPKVVNLKTNRGQEARRK